MMPIAVFFHCLFYLGEPPELRPAAVAIVQEQMWALQCSGLLDAASEVVIGINGSEESHDIAKLMLPGKAKLIFHGLKSRAENLTICALHDWSKQHPGWAVLYFHAKGATHPLDSPYGNGVSKPWRQTMTRYLVMGWKQCVHDLASVDSVGCHFLRGMCDGTQFLWAGNFWWANSSFLASLPSMYLRERIKLSGIASAESRFESEVWIGNGRLPIVVEYLPRGGGGVP